MVKTVTHTDARSLEIAKLKNLLEKSPNPPVVTRICDPSKSRARHYYKLGLISNLTRS